MTEITMELLLDHYPVFEANQVLTSGHLNDSFDYVEQQERLTRSHLIGIGIVCGLEITLSGSAIALSKGCGVTSEGYLIIEPDDVSFVASRSYTLPPDVDYPQFRSGTNQFALWELFEAGTPNTTPLNSPPDFLSDKAVLLFLELKKAPLRNCSPNNCDDKGSQVTVTVRRLLIARKDLDSIIARGSALGSGLTAKDIDAALSERLNLPDLRPHRFDVINSNPVTSNNVYTSFLDMIRTDKLAQATGDALTAAYTAFQPLLARSYPTNPFAHFIATYGFLDTAPTSARQVEFLQYYSDLFDDLLRAYDELRWKALDLICACCPDDGLFPRHLMLGLLNPGTVAQPEDYRQGFLGSPATGDCASETEEVLQIFARLVEMAASFTNAPPLPKGDGSRDLDPQIRITPSIIGCCAKKLESKAIPYYFGQNGTPPLYQLWSPTKTRRRRAYQNLSYNADLYTNPSAPPFITDPLRYDIEPYNFLRVEGHLGKDYQVALRSLLTLKARYRLPIEIIAVRTGEYDDSQPIDLTKESARFQDLDALYEALRGDLMSELAEGVMQLYDRTIPAITELTLNAGKPKLPLLVQHAPHYSYSANSVGAWYENYLTRFETQGYIDVDQNAVTPSAVLLVYCTLFAGTTPPEASAYPNVVAIYYISKLFEILPTTLSAFNYADFENKYQDLMALIRYFRSDAIASVTPDLKNFLPEEEFIDLCEGILFGCKLDALKAVQDEYTRRIGDLKRLSFLSGFLQQHPGVQHKAGVPLGGTFILVYHGTPASTVSDSSISVNFGVLRNLLGVAPVGAALDSRNVSALTQAISSIGANRSLISDNNVGRLVGWLTGQVPLPVVTGPAMKTDPAAEIIDQTVDSLEGGRVIADFFLPYPVSCGCPGAQYVLPKVLPTFVISVACTAADGNATATISAKGGVPPYDVAVDGNPYQALSGPLQLAAGTHSIMLRDTDGTETLAQTISVPLPITIGTPTFTCTDNRYTATASVAGGTPPYQVNGKAAPNAVVVTDATASGTAVSVTVTDSKGCTATAQFTHTCPPPCTLPCAGIALNRGFRFFLPDLDPNNPYKSFALNGVTFMVDSQPGKSVNLSAPVAQIIRATANQLAAGGFVSVVDGWIKAINDLIASNPDLQQAGKAQWLTLAYKTVGPGRPGLLSIEYFECLTFNIEFDVTYARARDSGDTKANVSYSPAGTSIQTGDFTVTIPAFDGTTTDKCADRPVRSNLCPSPSDFSLQIRRTGGNPSNFSVSASVPVSGLTFLWEAQDGTPAMGNGPRFTTRFASSGTKFVTVTGFNTKGCSSTTTISFEVG
jgi:hypothetical protein